MVVKFINFVICKIYLFSRKYLISHNILVSKDDFDFEFWSDGI